MHAKRVSLGWRQLLVLVIVVALVGGIAAQGPETIASQLARRAQTMAGAGRADGLDVLQLRPNFYVIAGAGGNIGVQVGPDGLVVVDSGSAARAMNVI